MSDPFKVVRDFEAALCDYTGAPFSVTTTSCTAALLLAVAWHLRHQPRTPAYREPIEIPKRTYVGVPMSIIHAGGRPTFREEKWRGHYKLEPLPIWDSARWFTWNLWGTTVDPFPKRSMICVSFHHTKTLGLAAHGGAILLDDPEAAAWLRRARFDGRQEGVAPKDQKVWDVVGWHCYQTPAVAAEGLQRLAALPRHNEPLPNDDYPDLSTLEIFK